MGAEENKAIVRRFITEAFNEGNPEVFPALIASDYVMHVAGAQELHGPEAMRDFVMGFRAAFPDLHSTVEDQVAEGDKVATRFTSRGTQRGAFNGLPPTGKAVALTGTVIDRVVNGRYAETWFQADMLGLLQQLGVIPAPEQAAV